MQRRLNLAAGTNALHLTELVVDSGHRRQGIGNALMNVVAQRAIEQQVPAITLGVVASNHEAHAFYQALGFQISRSTGYRGSLAGPALYRLAHRS